MKYIKLFESIELNSNIKSELNEIIELNIKVNNFSNSFNGNVEEKFKSKEFINLLEQKEKIEKRIEEKLIPFIDKLCDNKDFEEAKKFVAKSYNGIQSSGKILLFRKILLKEKGS